MDFQVKNIDGPARIGRFTLDRKTIQTPNILFLHTSRWKAPDFSDILLTNKISQTKKPTVRIGQSIFFKGKKRIKKDMSLENYLIYPKDLSNELHLITRFSNKNAEYCIIPAKKELIPTFMNKNDAKFLIVSHAKQLYSQQTRFVNFIIELRKIIGHNRLIYLPCIGDPTNIAFLTYIGVDFFDSISAILAARNEIFLFPTGFFKKNQLHELPCSCPLCMKRNDASVMEYEEILQHNYYMLFYEMKHIRNTILNGSLRELVEMRVRVNPHLSSLLRILDLNYYQYLEKRTPIVRKQPLIITTKDGLIRPEIRRFRDRVIHRFEKPSSAKILLLLPCSAKKPYSFSKSHRLFRERLFHVKNPFIVHEVIITSPLGVVPRELELTYPASSYDIAVTGHWDEDEKKMIQTLLRGYLQKNSYDSTIIHLPLVLQEFVNDLLKNPSITCENLPTSDDSLSNLSQALFHKTQYYDQVDSKRRTYENIRSLACYQFGPILADLLMKDCIISGKYPYQKILYKKKQLGIMTEERGLISLTMAGAERFVVAEKYWVEIFDDFILKGSVLAPGIKEADESIRIGDEVIVRKKNQLCGVGVACMNGEEMMQSTYGEAVKIRHHY